MLESNIENDFYNKVMDAYPVSKVMIGKIQSITGWPDRILLLKNKTVFFEFKRIDGDTSKFQKKIHQRIRNLGHKVFVVDSCEEAMQILDAELRKPKAEKKRRYPG